jgi:hypothetical protein
LEREGWIVAPCGGRPAMPEARRGPGGLSGLPGAEMAAAAGGLMTAIWSRCCRLRSAVGLGIAG